MDAENREGRAVVNERSRGLAPEIFRHDRQAGLRAELGEAPIDGAHEGGPAPGALRDLDHASEVTVEQAHTVIGREMLMKFPFANAMRAEPRHSSVLVGAPIDHRASCP